MSEDLNEFGTLVPKHLAEALKAEVERLKKFNEEAMAHIAKEERKSRERLEMAEDENAALKAQVERLTAFTTRTIIPNEELQKQVEELELEVFAFDRTIKQASCHYDNRLEDIRQLQAQVERLTKAGDAMAEEFSFIGSPDGGFNSIDQWNAAKEGKGQP